VRECRQTRGRHPVLTTSRRELTRIVTAAAPPLLFAAGISPPEFRRRMFAML
jgi:hypothetical protein